MEHLGIDVHKKESQICILAEGGELIERRIRTEPERFAAVLGGRPRGRILIEASGARSMNASRCLRRNRQRRPTSRPVSSPRRTYSETVRGEAVGCRRPPSR